MYLGMKTLALMASLGLSLSLVFSVSAEAEERDDYLIKSDVGNLCLDGHGRGKDVKVSGCRMPFGAQRWAINLETNQIKHVKTNLCVVVSNSNRQNGARVVMWPCNGNLNQRWALASLLAGKGQLKSELNGKCIDVSKINRTGKYANVHMWDCHQGKNQLWSQVKVKRSFKRKKNGLSFFPNK